MLGSPCLLAILHSGNSRGVEQTIRTLIEDSLAATKYGDIGRFVSSMAPDAVIIDENKMWTRKEIEAFAKDLRINQYKISEVKFKQLSSTSCVYAYRNLEIGSFQKQPFKLDVYVTTVWSKKNGQWETNFIQETNVKSSVKG